jgi:uncharacterized membrane protein
VKIPLLVLAVSTIAAILGFWLIGFPGTCGFTGLYGDALSKTSIGFWVALLLVVLPILGIVVGFFWAMANKLKAFPTAR